MFPHAVYHLVAVTPRFARVKYTLLYDRIMKRIAEEAIAVIEMVLLHEEVLAVRKVLLEGDPAKRILEYVESNPIDLLVISSTVSATPSPEIIGSTAKKIISKSNKPILVYTPLSTLPSGGIRSILVVANKPSRQEINKMLDVTLAIARRFNVHILTYVIGNEDVINTIESKLKNLQLSYKIIEPTKEYRETEVLELTEDTDLVIVNKTKALEEKIPILRHHISSLCKSLIGFSKSPVIVV